MLFAEDAPVDDVPPGGGFMSMVPMLAAIGLLFYFLMIRPQKRQQQQRVAMLGAIKKNDRVVTAGGIYGVVSNIDAEADEITIRVDETTNTKLRMSLGSISRVVVDESSTDISKKT